MVKFISFLVRMQDIEYITKNQFSFSSLKSAAYYHVPTKLFYWQHVCQIGNALDQAELVIKSLDDLDQVLFLISIGLDTKELQEMIDGDLLDTF